MPKKASHIWTDQIINGMTPEYGFDEPWYLGGPCSFGCRWKGTNHSLRRRYRKNGEIAKGQSRSADACACRYYGEDWLFKFLLQGSIGIPEKHKLGQLCNKGHDWKGTGYSLRRKNGNRCLECEKVRRNDPKRKKQLQEIGAKWYLKNKEQHKARTKANRLLRLEREPEAVKAVARFNKHKRKARERDAHSAQSLSRGQVRQYIENNFPMNECVYCERKGKMQLDHFYPLALGGSHVLGNLVPCCQKCNSNKRAKDPQVWYFQQSFATKKGWQRILRKINTEVSGNKAQLALF